MSEPGNSQMLVVAVWLGAHLDDPDLIVADVRWSLDGSGRARYDAGHIKGAVFVDVDSDLAGTPGPVVGRHPLPTPEAFAQAMGRLGIGDNTLVVAYDDTGGTTAARLWWMLRVLGRRCALLDGGIGAWHRPFESEAALQAAAVFTSGPWPNDAIIDADAAAEYEGTLVDARAGARFRGEIEPVDPVAGHIPGAINVPFDHNVDATNHFAHITTLREVYASAGIGDIAPDADVAVYCGSGVTACHDIFAMELAGLGRAKLFPDSWSGWCTDPSRKTERG